MRNICLTVAYDGSRYAGWQVQRGHPTLQAAFETAIKKLTGEQVQVLSAGRTDAGVHALGQVVNFRTCSVIPPSNWRSALQACLPRDILIRESREVAFEFHATFCALRKRYRYLIHNGALPLPFLRAYCYHVRRPLDVASMQQAAYELIGCHDFRSFETDWPNKATSVRTVFNIELRRQTEWSAWLGAEPHAGSASPAAEGPFIALDIVADGFLYNMVRSITGTLLNVGCGRWTAADVARILRSQQRSEAGSTAPACGLYLVEVEYPPVGAESLSARGEAAEPDPVPEVPPPEA